jgi:hypothetical protein
METWKEIPGLERYAASNYGNIKPIHGDSRKATLTKQLSSRGYLRIRLKSKDKWGMHQVHRLIAKAFIPNPENKPEVNHINGIRSDNQVENLEWCTRSENQIHAVTKGLQTGFNRKQVLQLKDGVVIKEFMSIQSTKEDGFNPSAIRHLLSCGDRKTHQGYEWKYSSNTADTPNPDPIK